MLDTCFWDTSRDQPKYAPIQWKTSLHCNDVFHWLGAHLHRSLHKFSIISLQWCHNGRDGVSNHQPLECLYSTVYSGADQRKYQNSASLAFVLGIRRWPVNSPHKWPFTRKCFHLMTSSCVRYFSPQVSVFEIPQRGDSPLLEELEPCDPERLAEEVAAVTLHPPPPLLSKTTDKPQPSSRSISIVARITGMNNYTPIPKTADKAKSGRFAPNLPKPKPTVTSKQIQPHQRTRKSTTPKPASSTGKNAIDNYKNKRPVRRRRSSDSRLRRRSKSPNLYSSSKRKERDSDTPVTLRTTVCRIDTLKTTPISTGSVVAAPSGATGRQGITLDTRRLTLNERTRASRSLPPRMHPSPYRQSSDSGQRSHTFPDPSPRSESRLDMSNLEGPRTSVRPESRTRRMYAWQAANGMLRPSQLDTPCIAPLWEHTNRAAASEQAMGNITWQQAIRAGRIR